ncbi:1-acyl-sn-glycerol-3-phosphate acyltransferase [Exiguobacterium sp. SL14]|nr:1-acyl-sn-glycerol-3-phosphate acyltransferase [Exiguobacterium sp. SL14]MCY1690664.1 1-acyl-sn-glycerol-3-phosphate acyltransferase [Exiguobacterium sp. SL14]
MKRQDTVYRIARFVVWVIAKTVFRVKVTGQENIPKDGSLLVCANHSSNWDPVFLVSAIPPKRAVRYMAKEELFKVPALKQLMIAAGTYPVGRGQGDRQALKRTIELLNSDETVGIFRKEHVLHQVNSHQHNRVSVSSPYDRLLRFYRLPSSDHIVHLNGCTSRSENLLIFRIYAINAARRNRFLTESWTKSNPSTSITLNTLTNSQNCKKLEAG